jgi:1-phosphatidylinositol-5-phosphate 4-kinase
MSARIKSVPKKKSKTKQKHLKAVHQKVKLFRANEPFLSVFMWGVNHTISELSHVSPPVMLMSDDFKAYSKTKVDNHNFNKESLPSHFKIKEYCPNVFRNLRDRFGIEEREYLRSLTRHEPTPTDSPGRSHASFYLSYDKKFVVKTLSAEEVAEVHSVLKPYHEYVVEKHGMTLLPQYLGMYRLTVEGVETYIIVMRNIFGRRYPVHVKYDLKGSTVQRQASEKEKAKNLPTFKDNDFMSGKHRLFLPEDAKDKLLEMLNSDVEFLAKLHLMDYSLLVGIHDVALQEEQEQERRESAGGAAEQRRRSGSGGAAAAQGVRPVSTSGTDGGGSEDDEEEYEEEEDDEEEDAEEEEEGRLTGRRPYSGRSVGSGKGDSGGVVGGAGGDCSVGAPKSGRSRTASKVSTSGGGPDDGVTRIGLGGGDTSGADEASLCGSDAYSQPTPPDSPAPSTSAFGLINSSSELDLTNEFYAIPARRDAPSRHVYFLGLIDILTYYGVKKRTATAAKTVKYGSEAEISTVKPDQYARRLLEFVTRALA